MSTQLAFAVSLSDSHAATVSLSISVYLSICLPICLRLCRFLSLAVCIFFSHLSRWLSTQTGSWRAKSCLHRSTMAIDFSFIAVRLLVSGGSRCAWARVWISHAGPRSSRQSQAVRTLQRAWPQWTLLPGAGSHTATAMSGPLQHPYCPAGGDATQRVAGE